MNIETQNDLIEEILTAWKDRIGADYLGYKGHVYRMFNFQSAGDKPPPLGGNVFSTHPFKGPA